MMIIWIHSNMNIKASLNSFGGCFEAFTNCANSSWQQFATIQNFLFWIEHFKGVPRPSLPQHRHILRYTWNCKMSRFTVHYKRRSYSRVLPWGPGAKAVVGRTEAKGSCHREIRIFPQPRSELKRKGRRGDEIVVTGNGSKIYPSNLYFSSVVFVLSW